MGMLSDREFWGLVAKYGKDFLQSTSNNIASQVSVPVDASAWLLRKAGIPVPEAPMLSSDWMKNAGITRPVDHSPASMAGEVVGNLAPTLAIEKAPQIAKGLLQGAENIAKPRMLNPQTGAIVWHGSPHKFNKFDSSKIGTGEGAQAYGHGLYLAESPRVANSYREALANPSSPLNDAAKYWRHNGGESAFKEFAKNAGLDKRQIEETVTAINGGGALYKVDLPDEHIAKMLDWDKPLSQQHPDVQKALPKEVIDRFLKDQESSWKWAYPDSGKGLYASLRATFKDDKKVAKQLQQSGIPGIRYLDGGSRGAGQGTSNYVVFPGNEDILTILERNGLGILDDTAKMESLFP